jgi:hypothetical protein
VKDTDDGSDDDSKPAPIENSTDDNNGMCSSHVDGNQLQNGNGVARATHTRDCRRCCAMPRICRTPSPALLSLLVGAVFVAAVHGYGDQAV